MQYIADYLYSGLGRKDQAIEFLFIANRDKVLDEGGRSKLVTFLHPEWAVRRIDRPCSISHSSPRIPGNLNYRVWLMHAFFRTNRKAELLALLKKSDEFFHQPNLWGEGTLAALAASCLQNQLFEQEPRRTTTS